MNSFDLIVLAIIAASALFAFLRGFVRESLSIVAWAGAAAAAFYLNDPLQPMFQSIISARWLVLIIEPLAIFVIALIVLSLITGIISSRVRQSGFGPIDRGLGLLFGLARGFLVLCVLVILLDTYLPVSARPGWITESRTMPMLEEGAAGLRASIPGDVLQRGSQAAESTIDHVDRARRLHEELQDLNKDEVTTPGGDTPMPDHHGQKPQNPADAAPKDGYSKDQRQTLDDTIMQATEAPSASETPKRTHKGHDR